MFNIYIDDDDTVIRPISQYSKKIESYWEYMGVMITDIYSQILIEVWKYQGFILEGKKNL